MALYRHITPQGDERTDLYRSDNFFVRWLFWERLRQISQQIEKSGVKGFCLDFGGGSGTMLPTLSKHFLHVWCMDLDTHLASEVMISMALRNVTILESNVLEVGNDKYNAIIAADVLEHFKDLSAPVEAIIRRLSPGGWLFTSLPTETRLYEALRRVFKKQKPLDHFHAAQEVEAFLMRAGFQRAMTTQIPIPVVSPLFQISAWKFNG